MRFQPVMKKIINLSELNDIINTGEPVLIYFSGEQCAVCHDLKPKIENQIKSNFKKMNICEVQSELHKEITSHFSVFSIPTTLVFFDAKEFLRVGRNMSIQNFINDIKRVYTLFFDEE